MQIYRSINVTSQMSLQKVAWRKHSKLPPQKIFSACFPKENIYIWNLAFLLLNLEFCSLQLCSERKLNIISCEEPCWSETALRNGKEYKMCTFKNRALGCSHVHFVTLLWRIQLRYKGGQVG